MLKLRKLQLQGFKSFYERAEVQFSGSGVVGIVGPNGCGKSNIADAISWVLGEQSAKSLRGGRMEDVIFAGTRDRAATGMAEVSLTLVDPAEYALGVAEAGEEEPEAEIMTPGWGDEPSEAVSEPESDDAPEPDLTPGPSPLSPVVLTFRKRRKFRARNRRGEIQVTRRLFRDGASEYLMNGRPCRLRDIQELFLGTGLGPESYAIIEQGRIGQILSSKPYDRRAIIEEAAGISKYKAKRRQAEARLEAARQNLARINDIFEEVTKQVASLKRQSSKAERYRQYKQEYDAQQRQLLRLRAAALAAAAGDLAARRAELDAAVAAAQAEVDALEAARAAALARCQTLEDELRAAAESAAGLRREADAARQQAAYDAQQAEDLATRAVENQAAQAQAGEQRRQLDAEHTQAEAARASAAQARSAAQQALDARQQAYAAAQSDESAAAAASATARRQGLDLLQRAAQATTTATQEQTRLEELDRLLERFGRDDAAARAELDASGARRGQLALEFQEQESEAGRLRESVEALEAQCARLAAALTAERDAEQQVRTHLAGAEARRRSLDEIVAGHGYSSEAVQRLFSGSGVASTGVLGEFIEAEAPYDRLVEQFLHDELNYVVVGDWDAAAAGVALLRQEQRGRATFLVHEKADEVAAVPASIAVQESGATPLLDHMKALNGFHSGLGALLPRLRDAYAVADAAQARALAERHPHAYFLTPDGACYHRGTLTGGAGRGAGPLSLKRELRELRQQEQDDAAALSRHQQQTALLTRESETAQRDRERQRQLLHELDTRRLTSAQAVRQLEDEQARAQARLAQAQLEAERARATQASTRDRLAAAQAEAETLRRQQTDSAAAQQQAEQAAAAAQAARTAAAEALGAAQAEQARVDERARAASATAERLEQLLGDLHARLQQLQREGEDLAARRQQRLAAHEAGLARTTGLEASLTAAQQTQAAQAEALATARAATQSGDAALHAQRASLDARRAELAENQVANARLETEAEHLRQTCRDDLSCELEALLAEPEPAAEAPTDLSSLEESVRALRQRIENLGPINMMALEEYEEARQRHEFMETQRRDLLDSIADTQKAIQEMDTISRQKFAEAFERINENFQESFRLLFGGGQGFLRMSEYDSGEGRRSAGLGQEGPQPGASTSGTRGAAALGPAPSNEPGVDIVAQPPGKKLQNALLLSGGEKAMTAMALLLAIFRYQPSPFCLLDEVDAPMDEANVARFADMVRGLSAETQFIVITHNKRTMEAAGTLYGVTMPQPGCSRLVSVMMEEQAEAAAS
ncbi:MAG: chromosome segregation protein SMC [Acidobacteria bacterium]|nr:MAG: chromosome segregation protein SMC [Acidobacteriota bacterium]